MTDLSIVLDTITLDDPQARDAQVVGSKAAGLAQLRAAGFDVPDGIVLPVGIADVWRSGPAPEPVRTAVRRIVESLGGPVAVRSSATWEDGATTAHAGATATVLDVHGADAVLDAVRHCLDASATAAESAGARGELAILIQRLVPADWAGVAFTADPLTGERDVVRIAATPGLGEALVQGEVVGSDISVRGTTVYGDPNGMAVDDVLAVARVAGAIEEHHGRPQDVEWAVVDGHVHVLQGRPITVLPIEPALPTGNNWQKDVAHYPEPLTPFGYSLLEAGADEVRRVFDETGLLVRGLEEVFVGGEIYGRVLPAFGSPDSTSKPPPAPVLGLAARIVPELRRRNATARHNEETGELQRWVDDWHRTDRAEMSRRNDEFHAVDLSALDDAGLVDLCDELIDFVRRGLQIHFRLVMPWARAVHRLHMLVGDVLGWDDATTSAMLAGHSPASRGAEDDMALLRRRVRAIPEAVAALEADPRRPVAGLRAVDPALADDLEEFVAEHGWAMVNYDAGVPVLAERPAMITRLLLAEEAPVERGAADEVAERAREAMPPDRRAEFDDALRAARAVYPLREDNTIVVGDRPLAHLRRWMLEVARRLADRGVIGSPADAVYLRADELRAVLVGPVPDDLVERILQRRGEEAWVRARPGPPYVGEQAEPPDISRLPGPLRRANEPVMWTISHEYPAPPDRPDDADVLLCGVAASPGEAEGPARVIRGHGDMDRLQDGDILVCQVTSPSWAPLFRLAAAVVADGGGALSHAAIAAREHGIPAVLGTGVATSTIVDGQHVRVDGTKGLVVDVH